MDSYEATRRIKKTDPVLRLIPIFAVTSFALNREEQKARAAHCDEYVPKAYSQRLLLAKIVSICFRPGVVGFVIQGFYPIVLNY